MFDAVIVMAGKGSRMGLSLNKALVYYLGKPLFLHSVLKFNDIEECKNIILVASENDIEKVKTMTSDLPKVHVVLGGERRQDSVLNGLLACSSEFALIHDAARPHIIYQDILKVHSRLISGAKSVSLASVSHDHVKYYDGKLISLDRDNLYFLSTPQGVNRSMLIDALNKFKNETFLDDTDAMCKAYGIEPEIILSENDNRKITTMDDMPIYPKFGQGFDVHRIEDGGSLVIGGVEIPCGKHFVAHSDGDVLLHAIMNALFGAIGSSDIGEHFPNSCEKYKNIESSKLCEECLKEVKEKGYIISNIDCTIVLEKPNLSSYKEAIRKNIASIFDISLDKVAVKANTFEGIGDLGSGNACECLVNACIYKEVL